MVKAKTSMRLSDEAMAIRQALARKLGIDKTAVVEMSLRVLAEREGITVKPKHTPKPKPKAQTQ